MLRAEADTRVSAKLLLQMWESSCDYGDRRAFEIHFVSTIRPAKLCLLTCYSLQFDPCPRAGEPMVSRRTPDYFL